MAALGRPRPAPERAGWDAADWHRYYEERAASYQHDGQRSRAEALRIAPRGA